MALQTEFEFVLPRGFVDEQGNIHQKGAMRLATALDEIEPLDDPRVRSNEAYLVIALFTRVITRLGTLPRVTTQVIERLLAADMAYLQDFYRQINDPGERAVVVTCPNCGHEFEGKISLLGES